MELLLPFENYRMLYITSTYFIIMNLTLGDLISQIGVSAVFVVLLWQTRKEFMDMLNKKDLYIKDLTDKILVAFQANTTATLENKRAVQTNTEATKKLTETVDSKLTDNKDK